jgi:hypothetical protein
MAKLDSLHKAGLGISGGFKRLFGQATALNLQEIRGEILSRLKCEIVAQEGRKVFPFGRILIRLQPSTKRVAGEFKTAFVENSSLQADIVAMFEHAGVELTADFGISMEIDESFKPDGGGKELRPLFRVELSEPLKDAGPPIPELQLEILKGKAMQPVYRIAKERLLIGSQAEVQDKEGRLVRKNNVVFPHEGGEINASVSAMHARIWFDPEMREFRIMDESSRYGTRLVRGGSTIEVPAENMRGIGLRSGDEVYFGQACMRLGLVPKQGTT